MSFSSSWKSKSSHKFGKLFYAMLITCKCTPFYKKLDCDTKTLWEKGVFYNWPCNPIFELQRTLATHCIYSLWMLMDKFTTTIGGYFAIRISSQTTKKEVSKTPLLRTIIPHKLLSFCDTITFVPVQSQVLCNSRTWYNRKTFRL
jgi:hypothetical protein